MTWYQKAADAGFPDGAKALKEVQDAIKKKQAELEQARLADEAEKARQAIEAQKAKEAADKEKFDPSIFQNVKFISILYYLNTTDFDRDQFVLYIEGFVTEMKEKVIFMTDGQTCAPLISGTVDGKLKVALFNATLHITSSYDTTTFLSALTLNKERGARDALILFNRYGCNGAVTHTVADNLNSIFGEVKHQGVVQTPAPIPTSSPHRDDVENATVTSLQLNLRDAPNAQSNVVTKMDRGLTVRIIRHVDDIWAGS